MDSATAIDLLQTLAEIGAAFAGFAALVSLFRGSPGDDRSLYGIANAVSISLTSIGASMLAAILLAQLPDALAWQICSALFGAGWLVGTYFGMKGYRAVSKSHLHLDTPSVFFTSLGLSGVAIPLLLFNLLWPESALSGVRFLLAVLCQLAIAAHMLFVSVFTADPDAGPGD